MSAPAKIYCIAEQQKTSTSTSDVQTFTLNANTDHILVSAETNDARIAFGGSAPGTGNGHVLPKSALPLYLPIGKGSSLSFASTAAGNCVLNVSEFVR